MNCPHCQFEIRGDAQFCPNCGNRVASGAGATSDVGDATLVRPSSLATMPQLTADTNEIDPLLGKTLDARYQLTGHLGHGGMGTVYRARRVALGDEVAVKVLRREFVAQPEMRDRFRREAQAAAMLHHPNIVAIYDFGDASARNGDQAREDVPAYIVMELLRGETLGAILKREHVLAPRRAIHLLRETCAGVGAAHARGIVHRDLKPDNVIVLTHDDYHAVTSDDDARETPSRESVKVVDFGIAKLREMTGDANLTHTGMVLGTPTYMSPEQCRGEHLDSRSDVYSLGAIAYEMLTGRPPFTAPTSGGVIAKQITEPAPPLDLPGASSDDYELTRRLEICIRRALSKEPGARQADATQFARELSAAQRAPKETRESSPPPLFTGAPEPVRPLPPPTAAPETSVHVASTESIEIPARKSSRFGAVLGLSLVAVAAALLSALAWMLYTGGNSATTNANRNNNRNTVRPRATPSPPLVVTNPTPTPSPSPSVSPTVPVTSPDAADDPTADDSNTPLPDSDAAAPPAVNYDPMKVAGQVQATLNGWAETTRRRDIDAHMSYYAPELDGYYRRQRADSSAVRDERRRAFDRFSEVDVRLSNMRIQLDATGTAATAIFDKSWRFDGDEETSRGAVQQELKLRKIDDRWVITGERDLRVYQ